MKGVVLFVCFFASALSWRSFEIEAEGFLNCHGTMVRDHNVQLYVRQGAHEMITEVHTDRYGFFKLNATVTERHVEIRPFIWFAADQTKQATPKVCFSHFLYNVYWNGPKNMYWHDNYQIDICACRYHGRSQDEDIKAYYPR